METTTSMAAVLRRMEGIAVVEKASIDEAFLQCWPATEGTDAAAAIAGGVHLAHQVKAAGQLPPSACVFKDYPDQRAVYLEC